MSVGARSVVAEKLRSTVRPGRPPSFAGGAVGCPPMSRSICHFQRSTRLRRWPLPRWRRSFLWSHLAFSASLRDRQYLVAFRQILAARRRPTLHRLGAALGITRQSVWQLEQKPMFREWLVTEIRLSRRGAGWTDAGDRRQPPEPDIVAELLNLNRVAPAASRRPSQRPPAVEGKQRLHD